MKVTLAEQDERDIWRRVIEEEAREHTSFLHSWEWGEMQSTFGRKVYRFFLKDEEQVVGLVLGIVMPLPLGRSYLLSPRGPVLLKSVGAKKDIFREVAASEMFQRIVKQEKIIFWRLEPLRRSFSESNGIRKVKDLQPSTTSVINLTKSTEELLAAMKQKTRYNVRLAEKKEVRIEFLNIKSIEQRREAVSAFYKLVVETNQRHGIRSHSHEYYQAMADKLSAKEMLEFCAAYHEDELLAMNIMIKCGDTMTYLHGGATHHKKNLMAPYLLQWRSIQRAKEQGFYWYDFYGVSPQEQPGHALAGVTRFKIGFGGEELSYPGTFEFPISSAWYNIYQTIKRFS